jgi:hypothetical protein
VRVEYRYNLVAKLRVKAKTSTLKDAAVTVLTASIATEVAAGVTHGYSVTCRRRYEVPGTEPPNPTLGGAAHRPGSHGAPRQAAHLHQKHAVGYISVVTAVYRSNLPESETCGWIHKCSYSCVQK